MLPPHHPESVFTQVTNDLHAIKFRVLSIIIFLNISVAFNVIDCFLFVEILSPISLFFFVFLLPL